MTTVAQISLRNGVKMPQEGLGVFQINDPKLCEETVLHGKIIAFDTPQNLEKQYQVATIEEVFLKAEAQEEK